MSMSEEYVARLEYKAMEHAYMGLQDQYSELARALGVEGDDFWDDPLVDHRDVLGRAHRAYAALTSSRQVQG